MASQGRAERPADDVAGVDTRRVTLRRQVRRETRLKSDQSSPPTAVAETTQTSPAPVMSSFRRAWLYFAGRPHFVVPFFYLVVLVFATDFNSHMNTGDSITTSRVALAGSIFDEGGLIAHRFKPSFYSPAWSTDLLQYYTHFPPLPYYYGWAVAKVGIWEWPVLVAGFLVVAAATLGLWIRFAAIWGGVAVGWVVALLLALATPAYAQLPYNAHSFADMFVALLAVAVLAHLVRPETSSKRWLRGKTALGVVGLAAFGSALSSFEFIPAIAVIASGIPAMWIVTRSWFSGTRIRDVLSPHLRRVASVVGVAFGGILAAMAFHLLTNLWALRSVQAVIDDWRDAAELRTAGGVFEREFSGVVDFGIWLDDRIFAAFKLNWLFVVAILALVMVVARARNEGMLLGLAMTASVLWVGFLAFNLVFRQWAWVHFDNLAVRHFIAPFALTLAAALFALVPVVRHWRWSLRSPVVTVLSLIAIVIVGTAVLRSVKDTVQFVADADGLSWDDQLADLETVLALSEDLGGQRVVTDDNNLVRTGFLHLPRDYFDLPDMLVDGFPRDDWDAVRSGDGAPVECDAERCVLVLTEVLAVDEAVQAACENGGCGFWGRWTVVRLDGVVSG